MSTLLPLAGLAAPVGALLALGGVANAAELQDAYSPFNGGASVVYLTGDGESIDVEISETGERLFVSESRTTITSRSSRCSVTDAPVNRHAVCEIPEQPSVAVVGSELADRVVVALRASDPNYGLARATLLGRGGDDGLIGGAANDQLQGGDGDDRLSGGPGHDWLRGGPGADGMSGSGGFDTTDYSDRQAAVRVDPSARGGDGRRGENDDANDIEQVLGGAGNDVLVSGPARTVLSGNGGQDRLYLRGRGEALGGPGRDRLIGGDDNNFLDGGPGGDLLRGGAGDDRLEGGREPGRHVGYRGSRASDRLYGGRGDDRLGTSQVGQGSDFFSGGPGDDLIDSADFLSTNRSPVIPLGRDDVLRCGSGADTVEADYYDAVFHDCDWVSHGAPAWRTARPTRDGTLRMLVRCLFPGHAPCRGSARLRPVRRAPRGGSPTPHARRYSNPVYARAKSSLLGRGSFRVRAGRVGSFEIELTPHAQRVVARRRGIRVRLTIRARGRYEATRTLVLRSRG